MFFKQFFNTTISPAAPTFPIDGLVARWPLTSNLVDDNGTYTFVPNSGSASFTSSALDLPGTQYFGIDSTSLCGKANGTNKVAISWWGKYTHTTSALAALGVGKVTGSSWGNSLFQVMIHNAAVNLFTGNQRGTLSSTVGDWGGSCWSDANSTTNVKDNWKHFVVQYTGTHYEQWINGTRVINSSTTCSLSSLRYFNIGRGCDSSGSVSGQMKYLYFYEDALTSDEISILYNSGTPI